MLTQTTLFFIEGLDRDATVWYGGTYTYLTIS